MQSNAERNHIRSPRLSLGHHFSVKQKETRTSVHFKVKRKYTVR